MIDQPAAPGYSKARGLLAVALGLLAVGLAAGAVSASLWAEVGDATLRSDIELLASYGLIEGPLITWPVPWAQISKGLHVDPDRTLPAHVRQSLLRVRERLEQEEQAAGLRYGYDVTVASRRRLVQGFDGAVREELDGRGWVERRWKSTFIRLSAGYEGDRQGDFKADGGHIAHAVGNWGVYGGYVDQWWGPGWGNSLILSNNARPIPRLGFMRLAPDAFETRWLSWMGHWRVNGYVGLLDDARAVTSPLIVGVRLTATPVRGFEMGITRTLIICGEGRPCDFDTWIDALFPFNEADNTGTRDDPSNQLAGLEARYTLRIRDHNLALYGQYYGEDEIDLWVRSVFGLFGLSVGGPFRGGGRWHLGGEYSDTAADGIDGRSTIFDVIYNHGIYRTGYRYRGHAIGHSLDGDSRLFSLSASVTGSGGGTYHFRYHRASVNRDGGSATDPTGKSRHTVSASAEIIHVLQAGATLPTSLGEFGADIWWQDDRPNTPRDLKPETGARISWQRRF